MAINVSAYSIRNPIPSILLFVMLTLAGLLGYSSMKIQQFPDIELPTITVTASLPGAAPAQMETEVARKIENSVATLQGVKNIYAKVQDGTATVTVEFRLEKRWTMCAMRCNACAPICPVTCAIRRSANSTCPAHPSSPTPSLQKKWMAKH
jgi:multidrug efflux pump subunit AcrB